MRSIHKEDIISSYTKEWEVLLDGEVFTNGFKDEEECIQHIEEAKTEGWSGDWSYIEIIKTLSIGTSVNYENNADEYRAKNELI